MDKMRVGVKNVCFCPRSGYKNCPRRGGGAKMAKFCPRSCWMTPNTNLRADGLQSLATKYKLKFKLKLPNQNFCSTSLKKISISILKPNTLNEMKNSFKDSHFKRYDIKNLNNFLSESKKKQSKWYFVTKIVLTYCDKKWF